MRKARLKYVVCVRCGRQDTPDTSVVPHNTGTATIMRCHSCADQRPAGDGYARLCRACCPTGHGTKWKAD
jgi:translation initiation factor 2 beta subunit (eIF-2beta)/eIF-5